MTRIAPLLLAVLAGCQSPFGGLFDDEGFGFDGAGEVIDGEFIVRDRLNQAELDSLGLIELDYNDVLGAGLYYTDTGLTLSQLQRALQTNRRGTAVRAENNRPRAATSVNDPYRSYQWNMDMIGIEEAWEQSTGAGTTVAVIDSGVTTAGEDTPVNFEMGYDFVSGDWDSTDQNGHGTHVAGTIAQATDNGKGVVGVAPDSTLLAIRALNSSGAGSAYGIASAIQWAADNGADVINLSLGSYYGSDVEADAIDHAVNLGAVVVAATGNEYQNSLNYPAAYPEVIAVGAAQADGSVAAYSNGGSGLDVVAPGGNTQVDQNGDGYADGILQETTYGSSTTYRFFEGTSMAAPHVAGVAAMLLSAGASPYEVEGILEATATPLSSSSWDTRSGYGLVNPSAALATLDSGGTPPTSDPEPEPDSGSDGADTAAPVISDVGGSRDSSTMTITWTTDEPATTEIEFEDYGWFGDESLVTEHELRFTVDPSETYFFTVISVDGAGNKAESGTWQFAP